MAKFGQVSLSIQNDLRIFTSIKPGETWREKIGQRVFKDAKAWDAEVVILTNFGRETDRIIN